MQSARKTGKNLKFMNLRRRARTDIPLLLMALPGIVFFFLFHYMPMVGIQLAFREFMPASGIFHSEWVGFIKFQFMVKNATFWAALKNTLFYNCIFLVTGILFPMSLAIALNEVRNKKAARIYQSLLIMPHFVTYVVVSVIVFAIISADSGIISHMLQSMGKAPIAFYSQPKYWRFFLFFVYTWKGTGYSSIIYLGTITGISDEYYEAAVIDGASKWQQIRHITVPFLKPMIVILAIMKVGSFFHSNFDLFYQVPMNSGPLYPVTNTIDVFVYNTLRESNDIGMSAAVAFVQSICGFVLVVTTNAIIRKIDNDLSMF